FQGPELEAQDLVSVDQPAGVERAAGAGGAVDVDPSGIGHGLDSDGEDVPKPATAGVIGARVLRHYRRGRVERIDEHKACSVVACPPGQPVEVHEVADAPAVVRAGSVEL